MHPYFMELKQSSSVFYGILVQKPVCLPSPAQVAGLREENHRLRDEAAALRVCLERAGVLRSDAVAAELHKLTFARKLTSSAEAAERAAPGDPDFYGTLLYRLQFAYPKVSN